jgi:HEPN domain-containing protein
MDDASVPGILLQAARQDAHALAVLISADTVHDSALGFHAQQAVEKSLKAVLSHANVVFRRTHDIAELLDLLHDHQLSPPPFAEQLDELNPYAVDARYGGILPSGLERNGLCSRVNAVIGWATSFCA